VERLEILLADRVLSVPLATMSLMIAFASHRKSLVEPLIPTVVKVLSRILLDHGCPSDYIYYKVPCPWLLVKCLRFLTYYKVRDLDYESLETLFKILAKMLSKSFNVVHDNSNRYVLM
jgi:AP-2 complex subunit alpha